MGTTITWTKIRHDVNGNPRFVCHFLNFVSDGDRRVAETMGLGRVDYLYSMALARARKLGGRRYHTKSYGGGIVFQCYDPTAEIEPRIPEVLK